VTCLVSKVSSCLLSNRARTDSTQNRDARPTRKQLMREGSPVDVGRFLLKWLEMSIVFGLAPINFLGTSHSDKIIQIGQNNKYQHESQAKKCWRYPSKHRNYARHGQGIRSKFEFHSLVGKSYHHQSLRRKSDANH
jgi:hypothetical protein